MLELVFGPSQSAPKAPRDQQVVISDPSGTALVFSWRRDRDHWLSVPELAGFKFRPGSNVITAYPARGAAPEDILDAYQSAVLPIVVEVVLGGQAMHASAVATPDGRVVAFCGPSESGKTTIAVGLSRRGCNLWADDVVAFEVRSDKLTALRLPFELNLREQSAAYFDSPGEDAAACSNGYAQEWARAPLAAVCLLERLEEPRGRQLVERLPPRDALIALLTHSFRFKPQAPEHKRRMMVDYLEVVSQLPIFRFRYRPGFESFAAALEEIEEAVVESTAVPAQ